LKFVRMGEGYFLSIPTLGGNVPFETIRSAKICLYDSTDVIVVSSCRTEEVGQRK
jgi:hypothetical protein